MPPLQKEAPSSQQQQGISLSARGEPPAHQLSCLPLAEQDLPSSHVAESAGSARSGGFAVEKEEQCSMHLAKNRKNSHELEKKCILGVFYVGADRILTIGSDQVCQVSSLSPVSELYRFSVKIPSSYSFFYLRTRSLFFMKGSDTQKNSHFLTIWRLGQRGALKVKVLRENQMGPIPFHLASIFPKEKSGQLITLQKKARNVSYLVSINVNTFQMTSMQRVTGCYS